MTRTQPQKVQPNLPPRQVAALIAIASGCSPTEAARESGVNVSLVYQIAKKTGVRLNSANYRKTPAGVLHMAMSLAEAGKPYDDFVLDAGLNPSSVRMALARHGVRLRDGKAAENRRQDAAVERLVAGGSTARDACARLGVSYWAFTKRRSRRNLVEGEEA